MAKFWLVPIALNIFLAHIFYPWFTKTKLIAVKNWADKFAMHYFFAAVFGSITALWLGQLVFDKTLFVIMTIGAFNGFAAFCQWKARECSMTFEGVFMFMDDVIAVTLAYLILNEGQYINFGVVIGLALCASVIPNLGYSNYLKKQSGQNHVDFAFFYYATIFTVIWGLAHFFMRYFAVSNVSIGKFVFGWYGGAFITAFTIFVFLRIKNVFAEKKENLEPIFTYRKIRLTAIAGATIFSCIMLFYLSVQLAPLIIVKPMYFVSGMVGPILVGLFAKKIAEASKYDEREKFLILQAIIGAIIIAFSFSG